MSRVIVIFQVLTVIALLALTVQEGIRLKKQCHRRDPCDKAVWKIISEQTGTVKSSFRLHRKIRKGFQHKVSLGEGCYFFGNRRRDEIYIDTSGQRVKMYLNVQQDRIYLTILKGNISINNQSYTEDRSSRIEISKYTMKINDIEVRFERSKS